MLLMIEDEPAGNNAVAAGEPHGLEERMGDGETVTADENGVAVEEDGDGDDVDGAVALGELSGDILGMLPAASVDGRELGRDVREDEGGLHSGSGIAPVLCGAQMAAVVAGVGKIGVRCNREWRRDIVDEKPAGVTTGVADVGSVQTPLHLSR